MFRVLSTFSGLMIARERGVHKVCNDGKVVFTASNRERTFLEYKIPARRVRWTEPSRVFYKKTHKMADQKAEPVPIVKIVRGFASVPKAIVENAKPTTPHSQKSNNQGWKKEKVTKNANAGVTRR